MKKKIAAAVLACLLLTGCGVDTMADSLADDIAGQLENLYGQNVTPEWQPNPETEPMPIQMPEPTKTAENSPIQLWDANDLELLRENPTGNFVLVSGIMVNDSFQPIDNFNGTLDGQGFSIRVFRSEADGMSADGLFNTLGENAVVRNLTVEITAEITAQMREAMYRIYVTGLADTNNGTISDCKVYSEITGTTVYYPIACVNNGTIENCSAVTKTQDVQAVYGFVGDNNQGSLHDCIAELYVEDCGLLTGLTNRNWADIADCTITATGKNVSEFYCVATQNYARISGCTFDVQLTPPAGEKLTWATSDICGYGDDFDSSNTVNVREVD
ncbi:MAG TPA: hypothetical protein DFH97_04105 [Clostridiales bacterium]|nr:hypothetical protein [Clostridiales bacterium]